MFEWFRKTLRSAENYKLLKLEVLESKSTSYSVLSEAEKQFVRRLALKPHYELQNSLTESTVEQLLSMWQKEVAARKMVQNPEVLSIGRLLFSYQHWLVPVLVTELTEDAFAVTNDRLLAFSSQRLFEQFSRQDSRLTTKKMSGENLVLLIPRLDPIPGHLSFNVIDKDTNFSLPITSKGPATKMMRQSATAALVERTMAGPFETETDRIKAIMSVFANPNVTFYEVFSRNDEKDIAARCVDNDDTDVRFVVTCKDLAFHVRPKGRRLKGMTDDDLVTAVLHTKPKELLRKVLDDGKQYRWLFPPGDKQHSILINRDIWSEFQKKV